MLHVSDIRLQKCGFKIKFCFYLYSASTCAEWRHWDVKIIVYIYIYIYIYILFSVALRPNAGYGFLILEGSRSHTTTHHNR